MIGGNTPDMRRHYLSIRQDGIARDDFIRYYPSYVEMTKQLENKLWKASHELHKLYVSYFIMHTPRHRLEKTVFVTLMQIHANYKSTRQKQTVQKVYDHVNNLPPGLQHILISIDIHSQ